MRITRSHSSSQQGFAHLGIILAIVGVVVVGGLVAWRFMGANQSGSSVSDTLTQKLASAKCDYDDKDLCKFFVSWKEHKQYKMISNTTDKESGEKSTMTYEIDGDNTHSVMTGQYASETIMIGTRTTYTKTPNGTWWKQTLPETEAPTDDTTPSVEFEEPETSEGETKNTTSYKPLGKEACGNLTCFKYQVVDTSRPEATEYIWFDTKSYQLRRSLSEDTTMSSDTSFDYDNVTVKAPASFKELGPDQYIMPGENEPTTMPSAADYGY